MKVAYLGYDILIECLKVVRERQHEILKIYTIPDGDAYDQNEQMRAFAKQYSIPISTEKISEEDITGLISTGCELMIVAGYPYWIPLHSDLRAINLHPELLPRGRGSWPMPVTILGGFTQSGVTIHKLSEKFDTGDILLQEVYLVEKDETLITLSKKIQEASVRLLGECLENFESLYANAVPQSEGQAEYWQEPSDTERTITSETSAEQADRILRAFAGYGCLLQTGTGVVPIDDVHYREVCITDIDALNRIREAERNTISAYTFPCIFCWKELQNLKIYMEEDWFIVKCDGDDYYFPCGNPDKTELFLKVILYRGKHFRLGYIPEEKKLLLEKKHPELQYHINRENFDYIVPMQQIAELSGKHFRTIRKEIHQFERSGSLETEEINTENIRFVEQIAVTWSEQAAGHDDYADTDAERSALRHFTELGMFGVLVKKDDRPIGFVMGTRLNANIVDVHFAKCIDTVNGADFYCKQMFCRRYANRFTYMNMEEDMGLRGMRTRKLLFRPTSLTEVYIAEYTIQDEVQHE